MKPQRRHISLALAMLATTHGLVACGGANGTADGQSPAPSPAPTPNTAPDPTPSLPPAPPATPTDAPATIANLAPGRWLELPNTKIRSVLPSPMPPGYPPYVIEAWSGGTVDTQRNRLLVWGGGHNDYWGNEIYAIELATLSVRRAAEPSPLVAQSASQSALPDGTPTSRHTYDGLTYIPGLDQMFAVGGSLTSNGYGEPAAWIREFGPQRWTMVTPVAPMTTHYGTMAEYDPVTGLVFIKDNYDFFSYDPKTRVFAKLNSERLDVDYHLTGAIDTKRRQFVMVGNGVQLVDLNTRTLSTMSTSNAPAFVTSQQSPGLAYDPVADRIVAWHGGSQVWALNMDNAAWSQVAAGPGPASAAPQQGTFGRFGYVPQYRVFVMVNSIDENAWVFRLTP